MPLQRPPSRWSQTAPRVPGAERARAFEAEGYPYPENHSPWQELFREKVGRFDEGMILKDADNYRDIARKYVPRDNH